MPIEFWATCGEPGVVMDETRDVGGPAKAVGREDADAEVAEELGQDLPLGEAQLMVVVAADADSGREVPEGREPVRVIGVDDQLLEGFVAPQVVQPRGAPL